MHQSAGIFLEMHPSYFDALESSFQTKRLIVLRYLITLWKVGVKIIFSVEFGTFLDPATQSQSSFYDFSYSFFVNDRQDSRMPQTNRANIDIGVLFRRVVGAIAKHLALGFELDVYFQANCRFILHIL